MSFVYLDPYEQTPLVATGSADPTHTLDPRDIDLYHVPRKICNQILGYCKQYWGETPAVAGFHWTRTRRGTLVARFRSAKDQMHMRDDALEITPDVEDAFHALGIDEFRATVTLKQQAKKIKSESSGVFSIQRGILRVLSVTFTLNSSLDYAIIQRVATNDGTAAIGHEMTHARQSVEGYFVSNVSQSERKRNPLSYYLQPIEVEAHVREIVNSARGWGSAFEKDLHIYMSYIRDVESGMVKADLDRIQETWLHWYQTHYDDREELPVTPASVSRVAKVVLGLIL